VLITYQSHGDALDEPSVSRLVTLQSGRIDGRSAIDRSNGALEVPRAPLVHRGDPLSRPLRNTRSLLSRGGDGYARLLARPVERSCGPALGTEHLLDRRLDLGPEP
jgi:hypothetical protein